MPVKVYKPTRSSRKRMSIVDRTALHRGEPHKQLARGKQRLSGRGSEGTITIRHRGGGAKRLYRFIDFRYDKMDVPARVERVEYDPNRSAFVVLALYADGERRYHLAWEGAKAGDEMIVSAKAPERIGNRMQLAAITPGAAVFNVEIKPGRGGQILRAAGVSAIVMDVKGDYAQLKMPSGEIRLIPKMSYATLGEASNSDSWLERIGSAGRVRRLGRRPQVRGKAMNPVDHPHGGGEGLQPIGMKYPKTLWGKHALGVKTRPKEKYSDALIIQRRVKKRS